MSVRRVTRTDPNTGVKREYWLVDIDVQLPNGKRQRVRKVSPIQTRRGALEYERDLRASLLSGEFKKKEVQVPTFKEFSVEFLRVHTMVHNKKSGYANAESALRLHLIPTLGNLKLNNIDERRIASLHSELKSKGLKNKSINNNLILLRTMLGKACEWAYLSSIPKIKKLPVTMPIVKFLSFDDSVRLEKAATLEPEWHATIVVALNTGLRLGELIALQWDDIDLNNGSLTVQRSDWQGHLDSPKSGKLRMIPLNGKVLDSLRSQRHLRGPWVFCKDNGRRRTNGEFAAALRRIRKRAGLQGFEWHALRHTFASHLVMRGVPMRAVQELMGHADMQMTLRYAHLSPDVGKRAVESLQEPAPNARRFAPTDMLGAEGAVAVGPSGRTSHGNLTATCSFKPSLLETRTAPIFQSEPAVNFGSGGRI